MGNNTVRRARLAAVALAPVFVLAGPAMAMAATDPGSADQGQNYSSTQTTTDRDGVHTTTTSTCMGPDGQVSYQRTTSTANSGGKTVTTTGSGSGVCQDQQIAGSQTDTAANNQGSGRSGPIGDQASSIDRAGSGAPLVVVNNPMGR